jgi:hypothetical protein
VISQLHALLIAKVIAVFQDDEDLVSLELLSSNISNHRVPSPGPEDSDYGKAFRSSMLLSGVWLCSLLSEDTGGPVVKVMVDTRMDEVWFMGHPVRYLTILCS